MRSLQDEIRQAQQELTCPICGRTFELKDIHLRNFDKTNVELSVTCNRGHFPVILLIPVTLKELARAGKITKGELKQAHQHIDKLTDSLQDLLK